MKQITIMEMMNRLNNRRIFAVFLYIVFNFTRQVPQNLVFFWAYTQRVYTLAGDRDREGEKSEKLKNHPLEGIGIPQSFLLHYLLGI